MIRLTHCVATIVTISLTAAVGAQTPAPVTARGDWTTDARHGWYSDDGPRVQINLRSADGNDHWGFGVPIAELDGVRVLGPEVKSDTESVRLAIDLRDTGRDAWQVACAMAGRGFTLDAASNRVIVVRLTASDISDAAHHRLASAVQLALWATRVADGTSL